MLILRKYIDFSMINDCLHALVKVGSLGIISVETYKLLSCKVELIKKHKLFDTFVIYFCDILLYFTFVILKQFVTIGLPCVLVSEAVETTFGYSPQDLK